MRLTQNKRLKDGASLLEAVRENGCELPGVAPYLVVLEKAHAQAVSSQHRRDALMAANLEATMQLNGDLGAVHDASIALRCYIKSVLGVRNPRLREYGIKPIRKRGRPLRTSPPNPARPS